ncbi:hypothetical protein [uncultured Tenacibaculum sp.]|uniref:hypothetical protein n=1 Tax=uncultured Tenacibaculum sp. TaxID=174713 RepID=UPI0026215A22|nr:hypothetical protein [uncultured Tenacibaculum sp.]
MENQNKQIANIQLHLSENCSDLEKEILQTYWEFNESELVNNPKFIRDKYNLRQSELTKLYTLAKLSFYAYCKNCSSYAHYEVNNHSVFLQLLQKLKNSKRNQYKCRECENISEIKTKKKTIKSHEELLNKLEQAIENKNWKNLSNFEKALLKNSLTMPFANLKKHYENILGQSHYLKFIRALETLENHNLLILKKDPKGQIENHYYIPKLLKIKDQIITDKVHSKSKAYFNPETNELKLKLTINKEKFHPDSPLYAGTITFKKQIVINPDIEYIFAQWERANNNLYFTLIPISEFEKFPEQKPISKVPKILRQGIHEFFKNSGSNLDF